MLALKINCMDEFITCSEITQLSPDVPGEKNIGFLYYFHFCLELGQPSWTPLFLTEQRRLSRELFV